MATPLSPYSTLFDTSGQPFAKAAQAQMDAMGQIARIGADTLRQVMKQQQAIALSAMSLWRETAGQVTPQDPAALMGLPLQAARVGTEIALQNASELAEIARNAQSEIMSVLSSRAEAAVETAKDAAEQTATDVRKAAGKAAEKADELMGASVEQVAMAGKLVQ